MGISLRFSPFPEVHNVLWNQQSCLHPSDAIHIDSMRATRVYVRLLRVLRRGKRIFKDSVRLIARFYGQSEYDKPLEC